MNALDFITATVEPGSDAASRFLDLAKACPRPNPSEHVRVGGIVRGEIDHTGWHLRFEWTHETGPHGEPWQDKPRAEIYVEKVLGAVRDRWATIGLRNNQVWISRPDVANSVFQPARSLQGLFAGIAAVPVHRTGDLVHADIRAVLTALAPRLIAAAEAQVTATVEPVHVEVQEKIARDLHDLVAFKQLTSHRSTFIGTLRSHQVIRVNIGAAPRSVSEHPDDALAVIRIDQDTGTAWWAGVARRENLVAMVKAHLALVTEFLESNRGSSLVDFTKALREFSARHNFSQPNNVRRLWESVQPAIATVEPGLQHHSDPWVTAALRAGFRIGAESENNYVRLDRGNLYIEVRISSSSL